MIRSKDLEGMKNKARYIAFDTTPMLGSKRMRMIVGKGKISNYCFGRVDIIVTRASNGRNGARESSESVSQTAKFRRNGSGCWGSLF